MSALGVIGGALAACLLAVFAWHLTGWYAAGVVYAGSAIGACLWMAIMAAIAVWRS